MEPEDLTPELLKLKLKCEKFAQADSKLKFRRLLVRKRQLLATLPLKDEHHVSLEQSLKDAAREKIVLNDRHYRGGWHELHRLRADLLELATELVTRPDSTTHLSASGLVDEVHISC